MMAYVIIDETYKMALSCSHTQSDIIFWPQIETHIKTDSGPPAGKYKWIAMNYTVKHTY